MRSVYNKCIVFAWFAALPLSVVEAQCIISSVSSQNGCPGTHMLSATSLSSDVTSHNWYDAPTGGSGVSTTNQFSPTSGVWVSQLEASFTENKSYWVAAVCSGSENTERTQVTFTLNQGSNISITLSPFQNPLDFCEGDNVTLTASGGSNYEWRFNDPFGTVISYANSISPAQSGTYYLTGLNSCSLWRTAQIPIGFNPNLGSVTIDAGIGSNCQGTTSQFTATSNNAAAFTWEVTGVGNTASAGEVTWDPSYAGQATITATAHGCNGTELSGTRTVTVYQMPDVSTTPSGAVTKLFGSEELTLQAYHDPSYDYQWFLDGQPIDNAQSSSLVVLRAGNYTVSETSINNCSATSEPILVTIENNYNYIISNALQVTEKADGSPINVNDVSSLTADEKQQQITYFDGLGRPMQIVTTQASPEGKDLIQPIVYDQFGREAEKYLPYTSSEASGTFKEDFISSESSLYEAPGSSPQFAFYQNEPKVAHDAIPYSISIFEPSPLNRIIKQRAAGVAWQPNEDPEPDRSVKMAYESNDEDDVLLLKYDPQTEALTFDSNKIYYDPNVLYANRTMDEHDNEVIEYVDKQGKTLCKKVQYDTNGTTRLYAETYYLYDDFDNLILVLQPEGMKQLKDTIGTN